MRSQLEDLQSEPTRTAAGRAVRACRSSWGWSRRWMKMTPSGGLPSFYHTPPSDS